MMFLRFLSSPVLLFSPNTDAGSGGTADTDPAPEPAAPIADPSPAPAPSLEPEAEEDEDDDTPLTPEQERAELDRVRRQAARYRTERREARQALAAAEARIAELEAAQPAAPDPTQSAEARIAAAERRAVIAEAAAAAGLPMAALHAFRALETAEGQEGITAALEGLRAFLAPPSVGTHRPPVDQTTAPTLDQQIADAEKRRDVRTLMRLKAQKATQADA